MISNFHKGALWTSCTAGTFFGSFSVTSGDAVWEHPSRCADSDIAKPVHLSQQSCRLRSDWSLLSSLFWCLVWTSADVHHSADGLNALRCCHMDVGWNQYHEAVKYRRGLGVSVELNAVYGAKTAMMWAPLHLLSDPELNVHNFTVMMMMSMMDIWSRILPLDGLIPNKSNAGSHCEGFLWDVVYALRQGLAGWLQLECSLVYLASS